jgi:hypothetical protein
MEKYMNSKGFLTAMSFAFFASPSAFGFQGCPVSSSFQIGAKTAENESLRDALSFFTSAASDQLVSKIEAQLEGKSCATVMIENQELTSGLAIQIVKRGNRVVGDLVFMRLKGVSDCGSRVSLNVASRFEKCYRQTTGTQVGGDSILHVMMQTREIMETNFTRTKDVQDAAVNNANLASVVAKVSQSLFTMGGESPASLVLTANGIKPDLFNQTMYSKRGTVDSSWNSSEKASAAQMRAEKIVAALLKLNSLGKAYVDINLGGQNGEAIVDLASYTPPKFGTYMGYDLGQSLATAMSKAGYTYRPTWE